MKNFRFVLLYFISSFILVSSLQASLEDKITFAITINKFNEANQNRIKRLALKLEDEFEKSSGLALDVSFTENENSVKKDFKDFKEYNSFVGYSPFFLKNIDFFKKYGKDPFVFIDNENGLSQYYLVANKKSGIKTIADLKGKVINSIEIANYQQFWLDYLFLKEFGQSYEKIIKKEINEEKQNKKLLNVYFNKVDFTVISKSVYDAVVLLNPSIVKNLLIIEKSKPIFVFAIGIFHKNTPTKLSDDFFRILSNKEINQDFSNIYRLIGIKGIERKRFKDFDELNNFYKEYQKLKAVNENAKK